MNYLSRKKFLEIFAIGSVISLGVGMGLGGLVKLVESRRRAKSDLEETVKHLLRINFIDPRTDSEKEIAEMTSTFTETDKALSPYFNVHVLNMPASAYEQRDISMYARDQMVEWGNTLYVHPGLVTMFPMSLLSSTDFQKHLERLSYNREIVPQEVLSKGGLFVFGKEFIFASDWYEHKYSVFEEVKRRTGLKSPIYFVPTLTSPMDGHIDSDYQIIDSLKLICVNGVLQDEGIRKKVEDISQRHNYRIKEFKQPNENEVEEDHPDDALQDAIKRLHELNVILDNNMLFTASIHPKKRGYLEQNRMEVVVVPLGKVRPGAGLRCVYGEITL